MYALSDKNYLVTGASSGIGRAIACKISQAGGNVCLVGRREDELEATRALLADGNHVVQPFDLLALDDIPAMVKDMAKKMGPFSGVVHSAGVHMAKPLRIMTSEDLDFIFRVNVSAAAMLAKGARHKNARAEKQSIIFISSVVGLVGQGGVSGYSASKGALVTLGKSLAIELARENIRVNCIAPGVVKTHMTEQLFGKQNQDQVDSVVDMHPLGLGEPEDIAAAAHFLLSEEASRWITGTVLTVDGGYTAA